MSLHKLQLGKMSITPHYYILFSISTTAFTKPTPSLRDDDFSYWFLKQLRIPKVIFFVIFALWKLVFCLNDSVDWHKRTVANLLTSFPHGMQSTLQHNILIKENFHNCNVNVWGNHTFASHFPLLYMQNLHMSHHSSHKYFFPGGAFDIAMFVGLRALVRGHVAVSSAAAVVTQSQG